MTDFTNWVNGVCTHPSGAGVSYCTSIRARLADATGLVTGKRYTAAKAALEAIARTAIDSQRMRAIDGLQAAMIITSARRIAAQLP